MAENGGSFQTAHRNRQLLRLPFNIRALKQRDFLHLFLIIGRILVGLQLFSLPDNPVHLLRRKSFLQSRKLFCQSPVLLGRKVRLRAYHDNGAEGIVQKHLPDKLLKVSLFRRLLDKLQRFFIAEVHVRLPVIEPGVKAEKPVHQAFRVVSVVCFPEAEFQAVDAGLQELPADALLRQIFQGLPDNLQEFLLLRPLRVLCHNGKVGLQNAVLKSAGDIIANACFHQGSLQNSSRRIQQDIIQNLEGDIQLRIRPVGADRVPGKIGGVVKGLLFRHGIGNLLLHRRHKGLLGHNGRLYVQAVVFRQIFLIQPV